MLCHLKTPIAVVSVLVFVLSFALSADVFEPATPPYRIYDEQRKLTDVPVYKPSDAAVNAFQELEADGFLFVGEREAVSTRELANVSLEAKAPVEFTKKANPNSDALPCTTVADDPTLQCQNYITVFQRIKGNKVIVCGTNALVPVCYNCTYDVNNGLQCTSNTGLETENCNDIAGCYYMGDAGLVAHNPLQETAWLYMDMLEYNGENREVVFTGANEELNKDSVISRVFIKADGNLDIDTNNVVKTDKDDPDWLNNAEFVGDPIEYGDHVYFFYRETATEYINAGKIVYSRVGRVCMTDEGGVGGSMLDGKWTTFQKARLNCSTQGDFPFYFNELQDVHQATNYGREVVYAIFTTPQTGATGSAVCVFRLDEIKELFETGSFKGAASPAELWLPVDNGLVPNPRPGSCATHAETDYTFIKKYPLMDPLVPNSRDYTSKQAYNHVSNSPLGIIQGVRIVELVVDEKVMDAAGNEHDIFFLASDDGRIYKMYMPSTDDPVLIEEYNLMLDEGEDVVTMKLLNNLLYIGTEERVVSVPVEYCEKYEKCYLCLQVQDPYCSWTGSACEARATGKQCLRETRTQEPYQCTGVNACPDWPNPMVAYVSENETFVVNGPADVPINLYFTATGPRYSNLDYSFECTCDDGKDCTNKFERIPKYQRLAKVEWVSVAFIASNWDETCNATVTYSATANDVTKTETSRIEVDMTDLVTDRDYTTKITNYDEMMAAYEYEVKMWEEDAIQQCYPDDVSTCSP